MCIKNDQIICKLYLVLKIHNIHKVCQECLKTLIQKTYEGTIPRISWKAHLISNFEEKKTH